MASFAFEEKLNSFQFSGDLEKDVHYVLLTFDKEETFHHVRAVTAKALDIAFNYKVDQNKSRIAAMLHDISAIVPSDQRIQIAEYYEIDVHDQDRENPIMLHGKISAEIAKRYFDISDEETLNAMRYHTTLRSNATVVEQIVFIADKIALDPTTTHKAEYLDDVLKIVNDDITKACWYYLSWMFDPEIGPGWQRHYDAIGALDWLNLKYK